MKFQIACIALIALSCRTNNANLKDNVDSYVPGSPNTFKVPPGANVPPTMVVEGTGDGNGGNGWLCKDDTTGKTTLEVVDYFEAKLRFPGRITYPVSPAPGFPSKSTGLAYALVERLPEFDSYRRSLYKKYILNFEHEAEISEEYEPGRVNDEERVLGAPANCSAVQLVYQHTPRRVEKDPDLPSIMEDDKRYLVAGKYWRMLTDEQKAVLILHEVIYREARYYGQKVSIGVRELVGKLLANDIIAANAANPKASYGKYISSDALKLPDYMPLNDQVALRFSTMTFHKSKPTQLLKAIAVAMTHPMMLDNNLVAERGTPWTPTLVLKDLPFAGISTSIPPDCELVFEEGGKLSAIFDFTTEEKRRNNSDVYYANFLYPQISWPAEQKSRLFQPFDCYDAIKPRELFTGIRFDHKLERIKTVFIPSKHYTCGSDYIPTSEPSQLPGSYQFDLDYNTAKATVRSP